MIKSTDSIDPIKSMQNSYSWLKLLHFNIWIEEYVKLNNKYKQNVITLLHWDIIKNSR